MASTIGTTTRHRFIRPPRRLTPSTHERPLWFQEVFNPRQDVAVVAIDTLERMRALCLALPEVTERLSHGAPTWFVRDKKTFVTYVDDHHGDGRLAIWCAAPPGALAPKRLIGELDAR